MIYIHGLGHFHPPNVIDNQFLEDLKIETNHQWIMDRVGIRTRRTVLPLEYIRETRNQDVREALNAADFSNAQTGKFAAEMALKNAGISAGEIGMVIAGGCSPDTVTPAEASKIAQALGIQSPCVDLSAACSSFGAQMHWLSMTRPEAVPEYILMVSPENNTRAIDYNDRSTAVLWGDGTSAAVVSTRKPSRAKVTFTTLASNPEGADKVMIPRGAHFVQEGSAVQSFAIKTTVRCYKEIEEKYQAVSRKTWFIGHQANLSMLQSVCKRCKISPEQHLFNVDEFGNTGAAGAPTVLSQNWDKFVPGDLVILVVVGAGLTWASMAIEFDEGAV